MFSDLSPAEFETWCRQFFERLHGCDVTNLPDSGDFGRDLLIHHPDGLIVVECKHTPGGAVGRPIIQKLHSAADYSGATRAYVATSGRVAKTAKSYAEQIDVDIEFFDGARLRRLSQRPPTEAPSPTGTSPDELALSTASPEEFEALVRATVLSPRHLDPGRRKRPPVPIVTTLSYEPFVVADFSATGSLDSAVGTWEVRWQGSVWLTSDTDGEPRTGYFDVTVSGDTPGGAHRDTSVFLGLPRFQLADCDVEFLSSAVARSPGDCPPVPVALHAAEERLRALLMRSMSQRISYVGGNNVRYVRDVQPSSRDLEVANLRVLRVPHRAMAIGDTKTIHRGLVVDLPDGLAMFCESIGACAECARDISASSLLLCSRCLAAVHRGNFLRPDSRACAECGAWVCWSCLRGKFQRPVCADCAPDKRGAPPSKTAKAVLFGFGILPATVLLGCFLAAAAGLPAPIGAVVGAAAGFLPIAAIKWRGAGRWEPRWFWFSLPRRRR